MTRLYAKYSKKFFKLLVKFYPLYLYSKVWNNYSVVKYFNLDNKNSVIIFKITFIKSKKIY